ncbi:MAG: LytTR family DNA-binding domain-containing protein [Pricia sp.]
MTTYLIIDDEPVAHDIIKAYCDKLPNMQLMKRCYDALEALDYLREKPIDLIFLDLNMPKLKGFEFLRTLPHAPKVIVTTAYTEYALEGYELEISDYLLKPFSFERFLKAVNKALHSKNHLTSASRPSETNDSGHIFLRSDKKYVQVAIDDISYIEAAGNYSKVVLAEEIILVREKLSDMLAMLPDGNFIQVHKSFLVAKNQIKFVEGNRIRIGDANIPIGKFYKANVMNLLRC